MLTKLLKVIVVVFTFTFLVGSAKGAETWSAKPVICNDDLTVFNTFYKSYNLYPVIGGGSSVRMDMEDQTLDDVAIYILLDDTGSAAIIEYHEGFACVLAFIHDISFDTELMKGFLKINGKSF